MSNQRSIFEEVGSDQPATPPPTPGGASRRDFSRARRWIAIWMGILFALVVLMIAVGGLTRLTDSGLSITEWNLVSGAVPPTSAEAWEEVFDKYKQIPEYQLQNQGMSLEEFKVIFWWEWGHRQLGRFVGLVWFVGFAGFLVTRSIPRGWTGRMLLLGALGGLQGAIGWWMVSSGLTGRMVDVASYRLATHLGLAFVILGVILWFIWQIRAGDVALIQARRQRDHRRMRWLTILVVLIAAQTLAGALVAGIDAGRGYIDWPLMNGQFLPSESFDYRPLWTNFFENPALVQFNHRMLGYIVMAVGIFVAWMCRSSALRLMRRAAWIILALLLFQMTLGILTIVNAAPSGLALGHQLGAVVLFSVALWARYLAAYPPEQSLR